MLIPLLHEVVLPVVVVEQVVPGDEHELVLGMTVLSVDGETQMSEPHRE